MKALIISEDQNVCDTLNETLVKAGYDTIIYKWLLKALDNIEEIHPDCIVVSSSEYPRHWKTLVQFVKSGIGGENVDIYLYEPKPMSDEDEEKARILGITDYFTSLEADALEKIFGKKEVAGEQPAAPEEETLAEEAVQKSVEKVTEVNEQPALKNTGHFMFTHPSNKKFISGKYFDYNGKTMSCTITDAKDLQDIGNNTVINSFTFFDTNCSVNARAIVCNVMNISNDNTIMVVEPVKIYEKI